jgi:hypothetical protein
VRLLGKTEVLKASGIAALLTGAAVYPRLSIWKQLQDNLFSSLMIFAWCIFVLWAFVFAWHKEYSKREVFRFDVSLRGWIGVTALGVAAMLSMRFFLDPGFREIAPWSYPVSFAEWIATTLLSVVFGPLFLIFAPLAFFLRLTRRIPVSVVLTVLLGVSVMMLRFAAMAGSQDPSHLAWLALMFALQSTIALALYLRGGVFVVWWFLTLIQLRHLPDY